MVLAIYYYCRFVVLQGYSSLLYCGDEVDGGSVGYNLLSATNAKQSYYRRIHDATGGAHNRAINFASMTNFL